MEHPNRERLDAALRGSPLLTALGIRLDAWDVGTATTRLDPDAAVGNLADSVHGGVLFSLADAAFEAACNAAGRMSVALETACHYVSPAPLDEPLVAVAEEVHRTRRTASYRIEVRGEPSGELRSWYMAMAFRTSRWHLGEEAWPQEWRALY